MNVEQTIKDFAESEGKSSGNGGGAKRSRRRNNKGKSGNNFQDQFAKREFNKGERAAASSSKTRLITKGADTKNDASWYIISEQIAKDAANINMLVAVGEPVQLARDYADTGHETSTVKHQVETPGIMTFRFVPTLGLADSPTDPINIASNAMYNFTLHANAGKTNYSACDQTLMIMAMDNVYMMYAWAGRVYGFLNGFDAFDRYTPQTFVNAMGVNWDSMRKNMANFRLQLNSVGYNLGAFAIPSGISMTDRHMWMVENIYMDSQSNKAQYYMYNPIGFYMYKETTAGSGLGYAGGKLEFHYLAEFATYYDPNLNAWLLTADDIIDMLNAMIKPIWGSQSLKRISADILKAFGSGKLFKVSQIDEQYKLNPTYEPEVLMQFENAYIDTPMLPFFKEPEVDRRPKAQVDNPDKGYLPGAQIFKNDLVQEVNDLNVGEYLKSNMEIARIYNWCGLYGGDADSMFVPAEYYFSVSEALLNFHKDEVTNNDIFVATRVANVSPRMISSSYIASTEGDQRFYVRYSPRTLGTEYILSADIIYFDNQTGHRQVLPFATNMFSWHPTDDSQTVPFYVLKDAIETYQTMTSIVSRFDWHPKFRYGLFASPFIPQPTLSDASGTFTISDYIFDVDVFGVASLENLKNMNTASLLKELVTYDMGDFSLKA